MEMNKEIERKIRERYAKSSSMQFDKFIAQNQDVAKELGLILANIPWFETIRNVYIAWNHNIYDVVKCKYCGQPLKVKDAIYGKHFYCSKKCADSDPNKIALQKQTCIKKYGASSPLLNEECKKKTIATCREKFGNDMFAGSDEYKRRVPTPFMLKETHEKSKQTKIEKYGIDYGKKLFEKRKESMMATNIEKYGVPFVLMNSNKREETHETMEKKYGHRFYWQTEENNQRKYDLKYERILSWSNYVMPLFTKEEYAGSDETEYSWKCVKCGNEFKQRIYVTGLGDDRQIPRCKKCFPDHCSSIAENELADFVRSIYKGEIVTRNQTTLKHRKELDIYIPEKNVAIEFDGLYWHSEENGKGNSYHLSKTEECCNNGIHLIHVFEDEWETKKEIVKDRIATILNAEMIKIFARKCNVKEIDLKTANEFLELHHLQGGDNSSIRFGLFYEEELVSVMTFGKPRFNQRYDLELMRFASKCGCIVVGGASKLLNYFRKKYHGSIISYADRRYSNGNLYKQLGFILTGVSQPNYWYVKNNEKLSRYACQKHKLPELLGDGFDACLSERDNMINNGYHVVYDCGNLIFEMEALQ